jgi:hypothetical protein
MIHIGPVRFDGSNDSLQLDRSGRAGKPIARERKALIQRNTTQNGRSELVLVNNSARRTADAPKTVARTIEHIRSQQPLRLPTNEAPSPEVHGPAMPSASTKFVSRFLTWCFPLRDFNSPFQRVLYLSMEGPRVRKRKRLILR